MTSPAGGVPFDERLLRVARADRGDCTVLVVQDDLDLAARGRLLEAAWGPLQERPRRPLVLDLSGVGYMAWVGAAELVMLRDECAPLGVEVARRRRPEPVGATPADLDRPEPGVCNLLLGRRRRRR
jgi:anti-anti-sigma regulatory factor